MSSALAKFRGFSLLELLLVLVMIGIMVGIMVPRSEPSIHDQLRTTAQVIAGELWYARSLAVAYDSTYAYSIDASENRIVLRHSGGRAALNVLPESAFRNPTDPPNAHVVDLDEMPHIGSAVRLHAMRSGAGAAMDVVLVEFTPLGGTTRAEPTYLWLTAGENAGRRFVSLRIDPVTGRCEPGGVVADGP